MTIEATTAEQTEGRGTEALAERVLGRFSAGVELLTVELGLCLGL